MAKIAGLTVPEAIADEIRRQHEETQAPINAIIRAALEEYFEKRGKDVKAKIEWGGSRMGAGKRKAANY